MMLNHPLHLGMKLLQPLNEVGELHTEVQGVI